MRMGSLQSGERAKAEVAGPIKASQPQQGEVQVHATVNSLTIHWTICLGHVSASTCQQVELTAELVDPEAKREAAYLVQAEADASGRLMGSGQSAFHFLAPAQNYSFRLRLQGGSEPLVQQTLRTEAAGRGVPPWFASHIPREMWRTYVGPEHVLGEWLGHCPEDMVWCYMPDDRFLRLLWRNACFTLPAPHSPITQCPNPISRYCLDLTKAQPWLRSKKVRRFKADFRLTVNADYQKSFKLCEATHTEARRGTWITPGLIQSLDKCRQEDSHVKVYSIELWEKSTGRLAAVIMALSVGDIFHDYTTATMIRDSRSAGAILTKVVGHLLTEAGYTLWYWGFKNPYMAEYDGGYGGLEMNNGKEFWPRWRRAMELAGSAETCDLAKRLAPGGGLDLALLESGQS
mmetsp:Transcript_53951/g.101173  ORF Transcript_53951/g.101173 Transcript_53951/m.101173 type:complete len:403 (+) Transcript_53951:35-1243(+)